MTAQEKVQKILDTIRGGRTVYFTTALKSIKVTPATLKRWDQNGHTMFKASGNSMMMASGNKFVCIDGCKITVEG